MDGALVAAVGAWVAWVASASPGAPGAPLPLTVKEAVAQALQSSPEVLEGLIDVRTARSVGEQAFGPFGSVFQLNLNGQTGPTVNAETINGVVNVTQGTGTALVKRLFDTGTSATLSLGESYLQTPFIYQFLSPQWSSALRLEIDQQLWRGFGTTANNALIVSARAQERAVALDLERAVQVLAGQVATAYWQLSAAQDEVAIRQSLLTGGQRLKSMTASKIRLGALPAEALSQAQAAVARRVAQLAAAEQSAEEARGALAAALRIVNPAVALQASQPLPAGTDPAAAELSSGSVTGRADLRAARERFEAQQSAAVAAEQGTRPVLSVGVGGELDGVAGLENSQACSYLPVEPGVPNLVACTPHGALTGDLATSLGRLGSGQAYQVFGTLTLVLPIEQRAVRGAVDQARLGVQRADEVVHQLELAAQSELTQLVRLAARNRAKLAAAEDSVKAAQALVNDEERKFGLGANTTFELVRAQDDLANSQMLALQAKLDQVLSQVKLAVAQGRILETLGVDFTPVDGP